MSFKSRFGRYIFPIIIALCAFIFFLNAVEVFKNNVALYHDAVWDFIPAVAFARFESVARSYEVKIFKHPIPIQSSPYSGALKIWLLTPIVKLLPVTPSVVLITNVLFGLIYLLALYWALLPLAGKIWSAVAFAIPFLDTNFLITVPVDAGIDLTQYIFIALALGACVRFVSEFKMKHYRLTWFLCGCLLAQKLTALPIAIGIMCVLIAISFSRFMESVRADSFRKAIKSYFLIPVALFIVPLLCQIYYFQRHGFAELNDATADGTRPPFLEAIRWNFSFFCTSFDGWDWYRRMTLDDRQELIKTPYLAIFGLSIIALALVIYLFYRNGRKIGKEFAASFAIAAISFLFYPAFRGLYRPWHLYILTPLFLFCFVLASRSLLMWAGGKFKYPARGIICAVFIFLVSVSTWHSLDILKQIRSYNGICISSPAFYNLYDSIVRSKIKKIYAINYSIAYPIYVLSKGAIGVDDLAWTPMTPDKMDELVRNVQRDPDSVIVYRNCGCKNSEPQWIEWINRENELPAVIKRFGNESNGFRTARFQDKRQTEYVVFSQKDRPID
jgi:hypothetical protein